MRSLKTIVARVIQTLLVVVTVAAFTGCVWQSVASRRDAERFPPPGTLVNIGKHRLHIDCRGSGKPTVLLESGAQLWSSGWRHIHESLAGHYRVCAYDRSGLGWSDSGALPYDAEQAVLELKSLLDTTRVDRPFVFVGHSYGGMLARVYHRRYPGEMAAAVYIDRGEHEMLIEDLAAKPNDEIRPCGFTCQMNIFAARLGIVRIVLNNLDALDDPRLPRDAVAEFRALAPRPQSIKASLLIARHMPSAAFQTLDAGHIADLPVLVIYSGNYGELVSEGETPAEMARWRAGYLGHWTDAVDASPDGVGPVEIAGANHLTVIAYREPAQLVSREISRFIDKRFGPQD